MIRLRPDCLAFKKPDGECIPCSAQQVVVELIGDAAGWLDKEVVSHASQAVLHYFRHEKGQETVTVAEFVEALEKVLKGLGLDVKASPGGLDPEGKQELATFSTATSSAPMDVGSHLSPASAMDQLSARRVVEADLREVADASNGGVELFFFPMLRSEVHRRLDGSPTVLHFRGLRECVKQIVGTKRWNAHCQAMNDRIVDYLRSCLTQEKAGAGCALVVM